MEKCLKVMHQGLQGLLFFLGYAIAYHRFIEEEATGNYKNG
jgi:hypothetical protein